MNKKMLVLVSYLGLLMLVGCGAPQTTTPSEATTSTQEISVENGDQVQVSYVLTFTNGTIYQEGETTIQVGSTNGWMANIVLLNAKIGDTFQWELTPEELNTTNTYDASKRQSLSQMYFEELGITPTIETTVSIPGLWAGKITKQEEIEGYNYYTIDFNAPETYQNINYSVQITDIQNT